MKRLLVNLTWLGVKELTVPGDFIHDFLHVIETHRVRSAKLLVSGSLLVPGLPRGTLAEVWRTLLLIVSFDAGVWTVGRRESLGVVGNLRCCQPQCLRVADPGTGLGRSRLP